MLPIPDIGGAIGGAVREAFESFLDTLWSPFLLLLSEVVIALYNINFINLRASWWQESYATTFQYAIWISIVAIGVSSAINFALLRPKSAVAAWGLFVKTIFVGVITPPLYSFGVLASDWLTEAALLGGTIDDLAPIVGFEQAGFLNKLVFVFPLILITLALLAVVVIFQFVGQTLVLLAPAAYAAHSVPFIGGLAWRKVITWGIMSLLARPLIILFIRIGGLAAENVDFELLGITQISLGVFVSLIFLAIAGFIPWRMASYTEERVDAYVSGGSLDKAPRMAGGTREVGAVTMTGSIVAGGLILGSAAKRAGPPDKPTPTSAHMGEAAGKALTGIAATGGRAHPMAALVLGGMSMLGSRGKKGGGS